MAQSDLVDLRVALRGVALTAALFLALEPAGCGSRTAVDLDLYAGLDGSVRAEDREAPPCGDPPWLLFEREAVGGSTELYAMRADGSQGHATGLAPRGISPALSVDGTELLYVQITPSGGDGGYDQALLLDDLRSGATRTLVQGALGEAAPDYTVLSYSALSPDGKTVAYTYGYDVRLVDVDGSNDRPLLTTSEDDIPIYGHPEFTRDSEWVLYGVSYAFGRIRLDGSDFEQLVSEDGIGPVYPNVTVSPDGARVAAAIGCTGHDAGPGDVTLRVYPLASLPGLCSAGAIVATLDSTSPSMSGGPDPSWGPSGLLAYGSGQDVFIVDPSGGAPRNMTAPLTAGGGAAFDPFWAPGCAPIP